MLVASIPFVRNIAVFIGDYTNFLKLTSLLHIKADTHSISIKDLETIHKSILKNKQNLVLPDPNKKVVNVIFEEAKRISNDNSVRVELEEKIVLAIAIRLKCEEYLIDKIGDNTFVSGIAKNQTRILYKKFKEMYPEELHILRLLDQINLMTPENIHLNSFMYEPILDMSSAYLKNMLKAMTSYCSV